MKQENKEHKESINERRKELNLLTRSGVSGKGKVRVREVTQDTATSAPKQPLTSETENQVAQCEIRKLITQARTTTNFLFFFFFSLWDRFFLATLGLYPAIAVTVFGLPVPLY